LPQFTLTQNGLMINCSFTGPTNVQAAWDFGDNSAVGQGVTAQHSYARPGRYTLLARLSKNGILVEYRSAIVVSTNNAVVTPLIITPVLSAGAVSADGTVSVTIALPAGVTDVSVDCSTSSARAYADTGAALLNLKPGSYVLDFLAMRKLSARFYSKQRYFPTAPVNLYRGRISTNQTFDPATGANTTKSPSPFTTQIFGDGTVTISPVDRWTLELPLTENPWFKIVSPSDIAAFDGGELDDAVLSLEFMD
jgi:PKD repeat protein